MKDIIIGLIVCLVCFFLVDFLYTTKHTCTITDSYGKKEYNCGFIKEQFDIDINLFDRLW